MKRKYIGIVAILILGIAIAGLAIFLHKTDKGQLHQVVETASLAQEYEYDVVVIGGEPEGVAAAVSAARNGAKTLLVEERDALGGLFTYGMLNFLDMPQDENGHSVSKGIFQEWHQMVGGRSTFSIQGAKDAFRQLVENEANLTLLTNTSVEGVKKVKNRVTAIQVKERDQRVKLIYGHTFIDATQDADFSVMAGAPHFTGGEDIGVPHKKQSVTLMIRLKDVDWEKVKETAASEKFGWGYVTADAAWGFPDLLRTYKPVENNTRIRGLNIAKVGNEYFINALQIFGVNGLDDASKQEGMERGKRETEHIVAFLRKEFPGFENAKLLASPPELYVRETRHIKTEYQLPMSDIWTNRDHWDSIGLGAYPVDIQAQTPNDYGTIVSNPKRYAIPFRSLIPQDVDGLLVVGRSAGYSSVASGSTRIVPTGMVTGEAAGLAAALAKEKNLEVREISEDKQLVQELRNRLFKQGALVDHFQLDYPYKGEWYDQSVQLLLNYGFIFGGYDNDLKVEEDVTYGRFFALMQDIVDRADEEKKSLLSERLSSLAAETVVKEYQPIPTDVALHYAANIFLGAETEDSLAQIVEAGILSPEYASRFQSDQMLKNKEMYVLAAGLTEKVLGLSFN